MVRAKAKKYELPTGKFKPAYLALFGSGVCEYPQRRQQHIAAKFQLQRQEAGRTHVYVLSKWLAVVPSVYYYLPFRRPISGSVRFKFI